MSAPRKYDAEFCERAVRMYREKLAEGTESKLGAPKHVCALLDVTPCDASGTGSRWLNTLAAPGLRPLARVSPRRCAR